LKTIWLTDIYLAQYKKRHINEDLVKTEKQDVS
jgi:hypothetical protein